VIGQSGDASTMKDNRACPSDPATFEQEDFVKRS
jgi:hypothetical protein